MKNINLFSACEKPSLHMLDLACGNLRFESFLQQHLISFNHNSEDNKQSLKKWLPKTKVWAVDNCKDLLSWSKTADAPKIPTFSGDLADDALPEVLEVQFCNFDIVNSLLTEKSMSLSRRFSLPLCDLSVCFGFMHHIPTASLRKKLLSELVSYTNSGGFICVSFWCFMDNDRLARKARATHKQAMDDLNLPPLDDGDWLLGWKDVEGAYRYCHHFTQDEIDALVTSLDNHVRVVDKFVADGRTKDVNTYLVLQVC